MYSNFLNNDTKNDLIESEGLIWEVLQGLKNKGSDIIANQNRYRR